MSSHNHNETLKRKRLKLDEKKLQRLLKMGLPITVIAKKLKINRSTIYLYMKENPEKYQKAPTRLGKYDKQLFVSLWNSGASMAEIGAKLNCDRNTVSALLEKYRSECNRRRQKCSYDVVALANMWNDGISGTEIAERLQISASCVYSYINTHRDECRWKR